MKTKNYCPVGQPLFFSYTGNSKVFNTILLMAFPLFFFLSGCSKDDLKIEHPVTPSVEPFVPAIVPTIIKSTPASTALDIAIDSKLTVSFNEEMDSSTINATTFTLQQEGIVVPGTISYSDTTAVFTPAEDLLNDTKYTGTLTTAIKDRAGKTLVNNYVWYFSTASDTAHYQMTKRSEHVTDFLRDGSRSAQLGNYTYSFGGWNVPEESHHDVYRSSGDLSTWEKLPDAPWHGRHVYGLVKMNSTVYVLGGDNLHSVFDVWSTKDGEHWTLLNAATPFNGIIYYGACAHNGNLYVVGGAGQNSVWKSPDGITWTRIATGISFLNGENFAGSLASLNGKMWMVCGGGSGGGSGDPRKTVYSSPDGITWTKEPDFGGIGRYYTDVCVWDNKLWVVGGYNEEMYPYSNLKDIWYMTRDGAWHEFTGVPADYIGRHATAVSVYNNKLVITCGNYNNDCWVIEKTL